MSFKFLDDIMVFYINLESNKKRKLYIENHFKDNKIKQYKRVNAIKVDKVESLFHLSLSELGCTLSHIFALKLFLETNQEFAMICEDDINLSNIKKIDFNFYETLKFYNPKYYCLQLTVSTREEMNINFDLHDKTFWDFSTVGYIVNKSYAELIVKKYENGLQAFNNKVIDDNRGGKIVTRPVADELVYSETLTKTIPIFCFVPGESSINYDDESSRQVLHSINQFNAKWNNVEKISIDIFKQ